MAVHVDHKKEAIQGLWDEGKERKIKEGNEERNEKAQEVDEMVGEREKRWKGEIRAKRRKWKCMKNRGWIFGEFGGMRKRREIREIRGRANV